MTTDEPGRTAHLVLTTPDGIVQGRIEPVDLATPWWPDVAPIVEAVRARDGLEVVVLRVLGSDRQQAFGGNVTYLAEVARPCALAPWAGTITDDPRRMAYARPGGPAADLDWARAAMTAAGIAPAGRPEQIRTWNLSSLWRLPSSHGRLWLKVVPPFFDHECRLLRRLSAHPTPRIVACDGGRMLMHELPGDSLYEAEEPVLLAMVELLVRLQTDCLDRVAELLDLGVPDWRALPATAAIGAVVARAATGFSDIDRAELERFVAGLPERFAALADCGLPSTLVHGDFHPGNCIGGAGTLAMLDFGDSVVGHPLLDMPAFLRPIPEAAIPAVRAAWFAAWRRELPASDPARAADIIAPIAAARQAAIYQGFLDAIEPAEHAYHRGDPERWLEHCVTLLRAERRTAPA